VLAQTTGGVRAPTTTAGGLPQGDGGPSSEKPTTTAGTTGTTTTTGGTATTMTGGTTTGTTSPPARGDSSASIAWANIGFDDNPGGNDPTAVALTFDDGPDGQGGFGGADNTACILDQLKSLGLHATFFVCSEVWTDLTVDPNARTDVNRMVAEGHDIANHTYDHKELDWLSTSAIDTELANNANVIGGILGSGTTLSMYRAPFGKPYQANNPNTSWVAPITAKYGVHIGWGIDTDDWNCAQNANLDVDPANPSDPNRPVRCIMDNLNHQLAQNRSGVILMHAVYRSSCDALPQVVQAIQANGYHIVSVEDLIQAKYGANSAAILQANQSVSYTSTQLTTAAQNACLENDFDIDPLY
jgi:peptidoglycan/xylan/chitin deacetylase (PgdA/CDA1 family)